MATEKYEVTIRGTDPASSGNWTMTWNADSFAEAEQLTTYKLRDSKVAHYNEIIKIEKDYDNGDS